MRWLFVLVTIACPLSWAAAQADFTQVCEISSQPECLRNCAAPPSCMENCTNCPRDCTKSCQRRVWDEPGWQHQWKGWSQEQKDQFLKDNRLK